MIHPTYESAQLSSMVEEVLHLTITLLTENGSTTKMPLPVAIRCKIIHAPAAGPRMYADPVKRISERMADDVCFEHVLRQVAKFRVPEATPTRGRMQRSSAMSMLRARQRNATRRLVNRGRLGKMDREDMQ